MLGTEVMPGRLESVRRTDQQHRAASDAFESRPAPSRKAHNAKPFKTIQQTADSIPAGSAGQSIFKPRGIVKPT